MCNQDQGQSDKTEEFSAQVVNLTNPSVDDQTKIKEQTVETQLLARQELAKNAFWCSLVAIGIVLLAGLVAIGAMLPLILCTKSWHVLLVFFFGFNTLFLGLLFFNMSSWSSKHFSAEEKDSSMGDIVPWIKIAKQLKEIFKS